VKKVLEDMFVFQRHCVLSLGICCAKLGMKHPTTEYNVAEERKCQQHIVEIMKTRKVLEDATREIFRRIFKTTKVTTIHSQALGALSLAL
jgi:hypothetical protein